MSTQFLNVCDGGAGVCEIDLDYFLLYRKYLIVCFKRWDRLYLYKQLVMVYGLPYEVFEEFGNPRYSIVELVPALAIL